MSHNTEIGTINNTNEWINWIEEAISKKYIKYYEYENFYNIKEICSDEIGKFYRANWKNPYKHLVLRSFTNFDNETVKEIFREIELHHEVDFHENFIHFYGVTTSNQENQIVQYMFVMDDADGGTLQDYLKKNFCNLTWNDKFNLAFQLTNAVSYLHEEGIKIVHGDLRSSNLFVHQNMIKLADLGMSNRIESKSSEIPREIIPYVDPKRFAKRKKKKKRYQINEKSDVYSVGMLLWEISSGQPPFHKLNVSKLDDEISKNNLREIIIENTPSDYSILYTDCWKNEPNDRPTMNQVVNRLRSFFFSKLNLSNNFYQPADSKLNNPSSVDNLLYGGLSQVIQNTEISMNEIIESLALLKEKFNIIVDEIVNLISKNLNEGKEGKVVKKIVIDYLNNNNINLQITYDLLLNNQNDSNSIFLLGYFNYYGIILKYQDYEKAYNLFTKALEKNNLLSRYYLFEITINKIVDLILENLNDGKEELIVKQIIIKYLDNHNINSQLTYDLLLSNQNNSNFIFLLGYFNYYGILITNINYEKAFNLFIKSEQNHILSQYYIGICYEFGNGTTKNEKLAFEYYKKITKKIYALGEFKVGYFYDKGIGVEKDKEQAIHWYEKAANVGHLIAMYYLGLYYKNKKGTEEDDAKAFELFKNSAEGENINGIIMLGYCYSNGIGTNIDKNKVFELYQKAANLGNNIAQHNLGHIYIDGEVVEKDYNEAFKLFKESAEKGSSDGITMLGYCYNNGIGVKIDKKKAFELYHKAANLENNAIAQHNLALMYQDGDGVEKDNNKAFELFKKSAEKEYLNGITMLGYCYDNGIGTKIDKKKAFELYQKATKLGNITAQHNLALMYKDGEGVEKDHNKAFELFKAAADKGYSDGITMLGYCFNNGIGTKIDKQRALNLYQKAANLGNDTAKYNLKCL
ncbi:hypothetical protein RclHR1_01480029 [Rhizophagus clarus]|uniref:Protein kinase domain-containing protein n=1 Tax=Rhizophagus clarus TaxID=94130 RepID=A0A2Z6QSX4_9GLOM|nr:hypothetical protein RclHR1_01480029 [Rhizophagus clarus]